LAAPRIVSRAPIDFQSRFRDRLDRRLEAIVRQALGAGSVLTVALADIDHFGGISDRFSRGVAEQVLRTVGLVLRSECRGRDFAVRYGPKEFVIAFPALELVAAAQRCEAMRRAVESRHWGAIHPQLRVTLSMGLASSRSFDCAASLLDAADHWLFEAKHRGRNQIRPNPLRG
jgi:diguanylate cyclase (GGDEF)-like protein